MEITSFQIYKIKKKKDVKENSCFSYILYYIFGLKKPRILNYSTGTSKASLESTTRPTLFISKNVVPLLSPNDPLR